MTTTTLLYIPVEGPVARLEVGPGENTGDALKSAVDGWFQAIELGTDLTMWMNDEGKIRGMEPNPRAQWMWDRTFGEGTDTVVGPVVLSGGTDRSGRTLGVPGRWLDTLERFFRQND